MPKIVIVNIGDRFGDWSVIGATEMHVARSGRTEKQWLCRCECGSERIVLQAKLRNGTSTHCGCKIDESRDPATGRFVDCGGERNLQYKHGHAQRADHSPEYRSWQKMRERCLNPQDKRYALYGGRGITVCDRWLDSFEAFFADMGTRPSLKHSLDRIDVNGNYEPSNCRWADAKTQSRNRNFVRKVKHNGRELCIGEWAEVVGIPYKTLHARFANGWSAAKALETPLDARQSNNARAAHALV